MSAIWLFWLAGLCLLWLPGALLARWVLRLPYHPDWVVGWAVELGLGLAWWPLLLLWTTTMSLRWSADSGQAVALLLCIGGVAALLAVPKTRWRRRAVYVQRHWLWLLFFACVLMLTSLTRLLHIRNLALPAWVDPVHHLVIVRLLVAQGALPVSFAPFLPGGVFDYHWGFHAPVAWLVWLLRLTEPLAVADLLLHYGQLLNTLTVVMVYAAGRTLFASRRAGLWAAVLAGTVSWFPAYYVTWGRYTHLAGMLLLCILLVSLWRLRQRPGWGLWVAVVMLAGGLALVHVRVAFFGLVAIVVLATGLLLRRRWTPVLFWASAGFAALLVTLPWWLDLFASSWVREVVTPQLIDSAFWQNYNQPNAGLLWAPRQLWLAILASAGLSGILGWGGENDPVLLARLAGLGWLILLVSIAVWALRSRRWRSVTRRAWGGWLLMVGWVGLTAFLLRLDAFGLPALRIANVDAGIISLYLPLALAAGGLLAWVTGLLLPASWAALAAGGLALLVAVVGAVGLRDVVNPATVLATPADRAALAWIRENTPKDAHFLSPAWRWQGNAYAGADGGIWIGPLTDRASLPLPVLYTTMLPPEQVQALNALLQPWAAAENLADPALREQLRAAGITHLYLGAQPSRLKREELLGAPYLRLIYDQGGVLILELISEP